MKRAVTKIRNINNLPIFERIYVLFMVAITSLFWILGNAKVVPPYIGLILICVITSISLLLLNDFKYFISGALSIIIANPDGYKSNEFPTSMVICGFIMVGIFVIFTIFNYKKITLKDKGKSFVAFIYFAIFSFIPLAYHNLIDDKVTTLIWVYFAYVLYLGVYIFFLANFNSSSWRMVKLSIQGMGLIIALECIAKMYGMHLEDPGKPLLSMWYYIGWGLCNEAGIMLCFSLPFVYMDLKENNGLEGIIEFGIKLFIIVIGMFVTTSRGTYLFGGLELVVLTIYTLVRNKKRWWILLSIGIMLVADLLLLQIFIGLKDLYQNIMEYVFAKGLESNGRIELYDKAIALWRQTPLTMLFGNGWVAERANVLTQYGMQDGYWVYHSTFFETLCCYGVIGLFAMIFHFYEKYKQVIKLDSYDMWIMIVGYVAVDLYGLIDNTYNFYYYMLPLAIVMAGLDAYKREEEKQILENNE